MHLLFACGIVSVNSSRWPIYMYRFALTRYVCRYPKRCLPKRLTSHSLPHVYAVLWVAYIGYGPHVPAKTHLTDSIRLSQLLVLLLVRIIEVILLRKEVTFDLGFLEQFEVAFYSSSVSHFNHELSHPVIHRFCGIWR